MLSTLELPDIAARDIVEVHDAEALLDQLRVEIAALEEELAGTEAAVALAEGRADSFGVDPSDPQAALLDAARCVEDLLDAVRSEIRLTIAEPALRAATDRLTLAHREAESLVDAAARSFPGPEPLEATGHGDAPDLSTAGFAETPPPEGAVDTGDAEVGDLPDTPADERQLALVRAHDLGAWTATPELLAAPDGVDLLAAGNALILADVEPTTYRGPVDGVEAAEEANAFDEFWKEQQDAAAARRQAMSPMELLIPMVLLVMALAVILTFI